VSSLEALRTPISSQLALIERRPVEAFDLESLPGDASDRDYVRVRYRIGGGAEKLHHHGHGRAV